MKYKEFYQVYYDLKVPDMKFRFYDPFNGTMIYSNNFDLLSKFFRCYEEIIAGGNKPSDIMQYTNFNDKNDKKIYQGDIIKNHLHNVRCKFIGDTWIVKHGEYSTNGNDYYTCGEYGFYYDNGNKMYSITNLPSDKQVLDEGGIEIIGNIYEDNE